LISQNFQGSTI